MREREKERREERKRREKRSESQDLRMDQDDPSELMSSRYAKSSSSRWSRVPVESKPRLKESQRAGVKKDRPEWSWHCLMPADALKNLIDCSLVNDLSLNLTGNQK